MIAKNNLPFYIVEKEGFQIFVKTVMPLYIQQYVVLPIPSRKIVTHLLTEKYKWLSNIVKEELYLVKNMFYYRCLNRFFKCQKFFRHNKPLAK